MNQLPCNVAFSLIAAALAAVPAAADIVWPGGVTTQITQPIFVIGETLTIEPGAVVELGPSAQIRIEAGGTLDAQGTPEAPIVLTGLGAQRWLGVTFQAGSHGNMSHVELRQLKNLGIQVFSLGATTAPVIQNCTVSDVLSEGGVDAVGIEVVGSGAAPTIRGTTIRQIVGESGVTGATGAAGTAAHPQGFVGAVGGLARNAIGLRVGSGAAGSYQQNIISDVRGGNAGAGGKGGKGLAGAAGADGTSDDQENTWGHPGGTGAAGGAGGIGTQGGSAYGIEWQTSATPGLVSQNIIRNLRGGNGAKGGDGGAGGAGGPGGDGVCMPTLCIWCGPGGDGGDGGPGGHGGDGGRAGAATAIFVWGISLSSPAVVVQNTIVGLMSGQPDAAGVGGAGGALGHGGEHGEYPGGCGITPPDGSDGSTGAHGAAGTAGSTSTSTGLVASIATVHAQNNIIVGRPTGLLTLGMQASGSGSSAFGVISDFNCFWNVSQAAGPLTQLGPNDFVADPMFIDSPGVDGVPGSDDDNLRLFAASPCVDAGSGQLVLHFLRDARGWKNAAAGWEGHPFDAFFPGVSGTGCLSGATAAPVLPLDSGTMTVSKIAAGGGLECAITDGSTGPAVSDGSLIGGDVLRLEFNPPIHSLYGYYGSMAVGAHGWMTLFSRGKEVNTLHASISSGAVPATGHGFVSSIPIDRVDVDSDDSNSLFGVFTALAAGEPSLGTVTIPGYAGPTGATVQMDFGCDFTPSPVVSDLLSYLEGEDIEGNPRVLDGDGDGTPVVDMGAYEFVPPPSCPADLDGNHTVNGLDLAQLLGQWSGAASISPCPPYRTADFNHNCKVNGLDLAMLLGAWGPCPK